MSDQSKRRKKWLMLLAKIAILALLAWGMHSTLSKAVEDLGKHTWHVEPAWLVLSGGCYALGMLPAAIFWQRLLVAAGQNVRLGEAIRGFYVSQMGKYVPGKAMVFVLRRGLLRDPNIDTTVIVVSVFFETLTGMAAGSLVAALVLATCLPRVTIDLQIWDGETLPINMVVVAIAMLLAVGLPTIPPVFKRLVRLLGVSRLSPAAIAKTDAFSYRLIAGGAAACSVGWLLQGLSLWAVLHALGAATGDPLEIPLSAATITMSVVAGFLAFMPGGLGVREMVQTKLLDQRYGPGVALVSAVILRLVWLVAELLLSSILYMLRPRTSRAAESVELPADEMTPA